MPNNKSHIAEKERKAELDDIISSLEKDGKTEDAKSFAALNDKNISKIVSFDYAEIKKISQEKATQYVETLIDFYVPEQHITEEIIAVKMERDIFRLSKQIVQLEIAEHAIAKLVQEIDSGNYNSRMWEVMASMMKSFDSMNITYAKLEILIENNYKSLIEELSYKDSLEPNNISGKEKKLKIGGHKQMLDSIKEDKKKFNFLEKEAIE